MITFKNIASMIERDLKQALTDAGYVDSGALKNSIKVTYDASIGRFSIDSLAYLKYLDDGKFYTNFMAKEMDKIKPLIAKVVAQEVSKDIKKEMIKNR